MLAKNDTRVLSLDFLRGVAILLVICNHCDTGQIPGFPTFHGFEGFAYWKLHQFGWSGVDLFFVLSGFLIGGLLLSELEKTGSLNIARFLLRRGLKLWPSYFVLLLILGVTSTTDFVNYSSITSFVKSIAIHVLFLQNYFPNSNGPTWSLAVEEHFYTLLPFVLLLLFSSLSPALRTRAMSTVTIAVLGLCLLFRIHRLFNGHVDYDYARTHLRFDSLFFGVYCQFMWRNHPSLIRKIASFRRGLLFAFAVLVAPAMFCARGNSFMFTAGFTMLTFGYSILLVVIVANGLGTYENRRAVKSIAAIGQWSYNIYLWHFFLPVLLRPVYGPLQRGIAEHTGGGTFSALVQVSLFASCGILAGYLGTVLIERPFLNFRDKYLKREYIAV
jgi:peptidoglycan/LPS O-acetylase OafA/YrhL